jgi:hypothetical protein
MDYLAIIGHQFHAWALGLVITLTFLDSGPGLWRDHPPRSRRIAGQLVGLFGLLSISCLQGRSWRIALLLMAPFITMAVWYAWAWWSRARAVVRRTLGMQTAVLGGISLILLMAYDGPVNWHGGVVIGAYGASAGLLGGLTLLLLMAMADPATEDGPLPNTPFGVAVQVSLVGLGVTLLGGLDAVWSMLSGQAGSHTNVLWCWLGLSLLIPLALLMAAHRVFPHFQRAIWSTALLSAIGGQVIIHTLLVTLPGLIPATGL